MEFNSLMDIILEGSTAWYQGLLKDKDGTLLDAENIATMTMTLYYTDNDGNDTVINSMDEYDVRDGGSWGLNVTVDDSATKNLEVRLDPNDNIIVGTVDTGRIERHTLLLRGTTSGSPSYTFIHEVILAVKQLKRVE